MAFQLSQNWGVTDPLSGATKASPSGANDPLRGFLTKTSQIKMANGKTVTVKTTPGMPGVGSNAVKETFGGHKSYDSGERFGSEGDSFGGQGGGQGLGQLSTLDCPTKGMNEGMGCGCNGACGSCGMSGMGALGGIAAADADKASMTANALSLFQQSTALPQGQSDASAALRQQVQAALNTLNVYTPWTDASGWFSAGTWNPSNIVQSNLQQALLNVDVATGRSSAGDAVSQSWAPQTTALQPVNVMAETVKNYPGAVADQIETETAAVGAGLSSGLTGLLKFAAALAAGYVVIKAVK